MYQVLDNTPNLIDFYSEMILSLNLSNFKFDVIDTMNKVLLIAQMGI